MGPELDLRDAEDGVVTAAPAPTASFPPIPIYGSDAGLNEAIKAGLDDPDPGVRSNAAEWAGKYYQTTYYSCVVSGTYSHCGWHRPIVAYQAGAAAAAGRRYKEGWSGVMRVSLVVGVVAWGLW